jgi:hypothetical protein
MAGDFGFCGASYEAPSIYQDAQECINWRIEIDPTKQQGERGRMALYPTPGLTLQVTPQVAEVRALATMPGGQIMLAIVGNTLYTISAFFTATAVGTLLTTSGPVQITNNGVAAYFGDGASRYSYTIATGVFAVVASTDGAFTGADRCDIIDNYIIYNRPSTQQWGATSPLSVVSPALSFSSKDGAPDNLVAAVVNNRSVFLLGELTSEAWTDAGLFPFPFQRVQGTSTQHGCASKNSIARLGNSFAYLSQDNRGQALVVYMDGYSVTQISTHAVTNSLLGQVIKDAIGYTYQMEGHECYVLTFPTADITWVYDLATQLWHKWLSVDSYNVYHRHRSNCSAVFQGQVCVGDYANGKIYTLSNSVYTEDGALIRRLRRCPHLTSDLNQIAFYKLQLQFQPGVGLSTGQGSDPQAMLRWSNDGGSTWSNEYWKSIGKIGKYTNRVIWRRLGNARDRVFEVVVTDPVKAVIVSANLMSSVGEN